MKKKTQASFVKLADLHSIMADNSDERDTKQYLDTIDKDKKYNGINFTVSYDTEDDEYTCHIFIKKPMNAKKAIDFLEDHWDAVWRSRHSSSSWEYAVSGADDQLAVHTNDMKSMDTIMKELSDVLDDKIDMSEH